MATKVLMPKKATAYRGKPSKASKEDKRAIETEIDKKRRASSRVSPPENKAHPVILLSPDYWQGVISRSIEMGRSINDLLLLWGDRSEFLQGLERYQALAVDF